ncbi:TPA: hypothetical protein N0F65_006705 [Lagenidium giganteum]|uniref:DDE Tnp4 domain-containing protein n=1 Tax=Lagenidium giganteum TaxID=4803 RepID=A0AAV2Z5L4_9STRA|nr:TPA: hypothetical protein N0F65_006705 [Lagenidium giganteum]
MLSGSHVTDIFDREDVFRGKGIYGDAGHLVLRSVCAPFKGANLIEPQLAFSASMSLCRQSVEKLFKVHKTMWLYCCCKRMLKIRAAPISKVFAVTMLMTNCHT